MWLIAVVAVLSLAATCTTVHGQVRQPKDIEDLKEQQPPVVQAASDGNNYALSDLLAQPGADVNVVGLQGFTALHMAAHNGYADIVHLLIKAGANVNAQKGLRKIGFENVAGWAPLHWAAKNNHATVVRLLVAAGAKVDPEAAANFHFGTPLHVAAGANDRTEALEALLAAGADVDAQDDEGNTPLHFAVSRDAIDGSRALLQYGADSMAANNRRQTPASSVLEAAQAATSVGDTEPAQPAAAFVEPLEATIDAIFDGDGPLGLAFAEYGASEPAEIESVKKGGAAAQKGLKKGMVLVSVQGKPTPSYDEAIAMIQATGRPITLSFRAPPSAKNEADHKRAQVTAATLLSKPQEDDQAQMTPLRAVFEEQKTSFGQWLRKHNMQTYARVFMAAGYITVSEVGSVDLSNANMLEEKFGVTNKKHQKKLAKLHKKQKRDL